MKSVSAIFLSLLSLLMTGCPPVQENHTDSNDSYTICSCEDSTPVYDPERDPGNVYLDLCVAEEWNPGFAGASRKGWENSLGDPVTDEEGLPIQNNGALGPPSGTGPFSSGGTYTCVGINGSAVWRFDEDYYIYNGDGPDFLTFSNVFAWGMSCDGLCCELAHVEISEDLVNWYYNGAEEYLIHPDPGENNGNYSYAAVSNIHGNNPVWANSEQNVQAQEIREIDGVSKWVDITGECVSRYFKPGDPYLGGVEFDLSDFLLGNDGTPWPDDGKMRYIRITDDSRILDGQDYLADWCLGANMMAAMGLNVLPFPTAPLASSGPSPEPAY